MQIEVGDHVQFKPLDEVIDIWRNYFPKADDKNANEFLKEVNDMMNMDLVITRIATGYVEPDNYSVVEAYFDFETQYAMPVDIFMPIDIEEANDVPSLFGAMSYGS